LTEHTGKVASLPAGSGADARKSAARRVFPPGRQLLLCAALALTRAAFAADDVAKASDVLKEEPARQLATPINDRFSIRASYFPASVSTDIRLDDSTGAEGTPLAAEDDFGLEDKLNQVRVEVILRMLERHRVRVDYLNLRRNGDEVLTQDIAFGGLTFATGDRLRSTIDWKALNFTYLYSIVHWQRFELGGGVGLTLFQGEMRARAPARLAREDRSGSVAYPTFALDGTLRVAKRFSVNARVNYLSGTVSGSTGRISDYHADVQYRWKRNLALGLGYSKLKTKLDITEDDDLAGRFELDVDGPELFVRASF
jgi:hypothetical protein